jgi:Tannase and feruloyl esterase
MKHREKELSISNCVFELVLCDRKKAIPLMAPVAAALILLALLSPAAAAKPMTPGDCSKLLNLKLKDTIITDASIIAAKGDMPEYCRVQGGLETVILFEVSMPTSVWNDKLLYVGGAGYNGSVPELIDALARGYAAAGSDTGHRGFHWDASAMYNNPQSQVNYAHRATHLVAVLSKEIIKSYYGSPAKRSYFCGCSNGGKMALMEAERYPEDFDGIVGGGPVVDRTKAMMMFVWTQRALLGAEIPPYKIPAMEKATLAACDAHDGLADGLIDRPDLCKFDPESMVCPGADGPSCLTSRQANAWQKILNGPVNSAGKKLYVGYLPGHEGDFPAYITGIGTMHGYPSSNFMYEDSFMRWIVFGPQFDSVRDFEFEKSPATLVKFEKDQDAGSADLAAFQKHGGKLILYNGWADHSTPPLRVVEYFDELQRKTPNRDEFVRLFMIPGLYHCNGGPGPNVFGGLGQRGYKKNDPASDIIGALDQWVEKGVAPSKLLTTKFKGDDPRQGAVRTRPVCPYPQMATYTGSGSVDEAANFVCAIPKATAAAK